jgi:uncharacterized protein YdhG (YjbR/CyaY superfamily)
MKTVQAKNVDAYIAGFPEGTQQMLNEMRTLIVKNAPAAEESISYGMPAYKLFKKPLVYFAGYEKHIGFYATPTGHEAFKEELSKYKQGKGSVQFPLMEKLPKKLIADIVKYRVLEAGEKQKKNSLEKTCTEGHRFTKTSDCPTCPVCEAAKNKVYFVKLGAPAQRALQSIGVTEVSQLATFSEEEILALHGMGKASIPVLLAVLGEHGLNFKNKQP